jgi:hypothetical protein
MTPDPVAVLTDAVRVRELLSVLRALEGDGAMPLVFKGAALAHTHYAESWHRPRLDADILIPPECRERVFVTLAGLGYHRGTLISGELVMSQAPFLRTDHLGIEHALDVHWRIVNPQPVSGTLTHAELVERSQVVTVQGHPLRVPWSVDSLLIACLHRVHHPEFQQSYWTEDIHRLASRFDRSEWQAFTAAAGSCAIRALCLEGLRLAEARFQTALPFDVVTTLSEGAPEPSAVFLRKDLRPVDRLRADLRALRPRAAARLIREHLLPPADYMQAKYGVTSRVWLPACYAIRVWQGLSKWLKAT